MGQARRFGTAEAAELQQVLESQELWRGNGPIWSAGSGENSSVDRFEDAFAQWTGLPYVHAVNSGTSANEAAVWSLGLPAGSEVICPAASPIFVPMAVLAAGCIPVFVDVDPATMMIDPDAIAAAITDRTRAIIALHLWGRPAPIDEILAVAQQHGLLVIEDCAQAAATTLRGRRLGTFGDVACFSLQQSKLLSSGEGGVVGTSSAAGYVRAALYSNAGIPNLRFGTSVTDIGLASDRDVQSFGHNHRMSGLQGAVALAQLARAAELIEGREDAVRRLREAVDELGEPRVRIFDDVDGADISYWKLPVRVPDGVGNYIGTPETEPVFARMETERTTPFGLPLPDSVHYGPERCVGALEGGRRVFVLAVDPDSDAGHALQPLLQRLEPA